MVTPKTITLTVFDDGNSSDGNQGNIAKVLELAVSLITSGAPLDKDPYDLIVAREPFGELGRLLQSMGLLEPIEAPAED